MRVIYLSTLFESTARGDSDTVIKRNIRYMHNFYFLGGHNYEGNILKHPV